MGLRDIGAALPPGFRFYPSDEELVCHYLFKKIANEEVLKGTLVEIDLHTCEPWQLPEVAKLNANEWYFFSFRDRKYATGYRTNRATTSGYWKATGKDRMVVDPMTGELVGMRKTLVFYRNRAPNGIKTGWIMHEFRLETPHMPPKEDWVLCRVFHKSKGDEQKYAANLNSPQLDTVCNNIPPSLNSSTASALPADSSTVPFTGFNHQTQILPYSLLKPSCHNLHHFQNINNNNNTSHGNDNNSNNNTKNQTSFLNLLQFSQEKTTHNQNIFTTESNTKIDEGDGFGFLWDDVNNMEGTSSLEDMRFEIDNSMVFL